MTGTYSCGIEACDYRGDSPEGLRSHVAASADQEHQRARTNRAWEGWYPAGYGVVDAGTDDESDDEGGPEGGQPGDGGGDDDLDATLLDTPSKGGDEGGPTPSNAGSDDDEYAQQWQNAEPTDDDRGESGDGDGDDDPQPTEPVDPSKGGGEGDTTRLLALATPLLALLALLWTGSDDERKGSTASKGSEGSETPQLEGETAPSEPAETPSAPPSDTPSGDESSGSNGGYSPWDA